MQGDFHIYLNKLLLIFRQLVLSLELPTFLIYAREPKQEQEETPPNSIYLIFLFCPGNLLDIVLLRF